MLAVQSASIFPKTPKQVLEGLDAPLAAAAEAAAQQPAAPLGAYCSQSWAGGGGGGGALPAPQRARLRAGTEVAGAQPAHPQRPKGDC